MKNVTWESVIETLGFDPRVPAPMTRTEDDWVIDDSKPNPFSVLSDEERQFLMDNWIVPKARKTTVA